MTILPNTVKDRELVLCVRQEDWQRQLDSGAYTAHSHVNAPAYYSGVGDGSGCPDAAELPLLLLPRLLCEQDPTYRQLVPYITVQPRMRDGSVAQDTMLLYQRTHGEERRLTDRYSIGLGGHVNLCDVTNLNEQAGMKSLASLSDAVLAAAVRELFEELPEWMWNAASPATSSWLQGEAELRGIIDYRGDDVGRVHLGFHLHVALDASLWEYLPDGLTTAITIDCGNGTFATRDEIMSTHYHALEPWSQTVFNAHSW